MPEEMITMIKKAPGRMVAITGDLAEADFSGVTREVSLLLCPEVHEGDYVLVHVGFAIHSPSSGSRRKRLSRPWRS